jgi:3D (Asp-Asp-Asp) domain-containing protein
MSRGNLRRALAGLVACALVAITVVAATASNQATKAAAKARWLKGVAITEYWPVPEKWFRGRRVKAPGIAGLHRVDWLYSGTGMLMEGDGLGLDSRHFHVESFGNERWVNAKGQPTKATRSGVWSNGDAAWAAGGGWRNAQGAVTFPLDGVGWSNGPAASYTAPRRISFGSGESLPLRYYNSVATDPRTIPKGSRIYIPAYRKVNGGWFTAVDTGSGIIGRHIDVFRPPPPTPNGGRFLRNQRVRVIPPHR